MNILKQIRLRYHWAKSAQANVYIIRKINKYLEKLRKEYRLDPYNIDKQKSIDNCLDDLKKYEGRFGHNILNIFSKKELEDDGFLPDEHEFSELERLLKFIKKNIK